MKTHQLGSLELTLPDDVVVAETSQLEPQAPVAPTRGRGRGPSLPKGPVSSTELFGPTAAAGDLIVDALLKQDLELEQSFELTRAAGAPKRAMPEPSRGVIEVGEDENAVVLIEQDGVYSWRLGTIVEPQPGTRQRSGARLLPARRRIEFDLQLDPVPDASKEAKRTRGPVTDFLIGKARGWVFRFIAKVATDRIVAFLERKKRLGLVAMAGDDPLNWRDIATLGEIALPADRAARILLYVHGTFSSTVGSFGDLGANQWGRDFLNVSATGYDAVIGFDHRTLSEDPLQNATELLGMLEGSSAPGLDIDAICFSRGGLVLRSLIEYLLPKTSNIVVNRAVFVAATNSGTLLASPKNWKTLIDITTNLVAAGARVTTLIAPPAGLVAKIVSESISTLGALVKALAEVALDARHVPGLAAMTPDGQFVTSINETQPGQAPAGKALYYAITSDFNVGKVTDDIDGIKPGLVKWLADAVVDAEMKEPSDLVVHNRSTVTIDPGAGEFFSDKYHFASNPHVYHTVFFTRPEVATQITRWFGFGVTVAAARRRIFTIDTTEPLGSAIELMKGAPDFIVGRREDAGMRFFYAFRREELNRVADGNPAKLNLSIEEALKGTPLELHEDGSSTEEVDGQARPWRGSLGPTADRDVVINRGEVVDVREQGGGVRSAAQLAALNNLAAAPLTTPMPAGVAMRGMTRAKPPTRGPVATAEAPAAGSSAAPPRTRGGKRGGRPAAPGGARRGAPSDTLTRSAAAPPPPTTPAPVTVYASAEMPEEIPLGATAILTVEVSRRKLTITVGLTRATGEATVDPTLPLYLQVIGKRNISVAAPDRHQVELARESTELIFDLTGTAEGPGEVWVSLRQGPQALLTMKLKPTIIAAQATPSGNRVHGKGAAEALGAGLKDCPVLLIHEVIEGNAWQYKYTFIRGPADVVTGESMTSTVPRDVYVETLYQRIEGFWVSSKSDVKAFEAAIRGYGAQLLDQLVPASIQLALWDARNALKAILVVSEEPFIPWELVHLKEPSPPGRPPHALPSESHFLGEKGLVRWLNDHGPAALELTIRKDKSWHAVPVYPGKMALPYAQDEIPYLTKIGSKPIATIDEPTIRALLASADVDHFHFSGHGEADAKRAVDGHVLLSLTQEQGAWVPRYLDTTTVEQNANLEGAGGRKPLIVLNACQAGRLGFRLTSIGGFAEAFVRCGAGAFVGSLWSVGDIKAKDFSEGFYQSLFGGSTLAEATTAGRKAARAADDATWIAYVVYGYPGAKISLQT